jgi:hypothetical protein
MLFRAVFCLAAICVMQSLAPASAQADLDPTPVPTAATEDKYVTFSSPEEMLALLTEPGRCPDGYLPKPGHPCAYLQYREYLRPVFEVQKGLILSYSTGRGLILGSAEQMFYLESENRQGGKRIFSTPEGMLGESENAARAAEGKDALNPVYFKQYAEGGPQERALGPDCIKVIWGVGMTHTSFPKCDIHRLRTRK